MNYNYWVVMSDAFRLDLVAAFNLAGEPAPTPSVAFPYINVADDQTVDVFRRRIAWETDRFVVPAGYQLWNIYSRNLNLSTQAPVRIDFDDWVQAYPSDFQCEGAWDWNGQPIGGVGAPWFTTPTVA